MSDAIQPSSFRRMRHTPLRDVLRGRLTGRLDVRRRIDASDLPAPLKDLIRRVVLRTRLWRSEQVEVADELIAHFADALADGETESALVERFGDARDAAKLIRRSVKRKRSIFWKAMETLRWLCVAMLVFYALSAAYFFAGKPDARVNYVAEMNRRATAAPVDQRAWTLYRKVFPQLKLEETQRAIEGPDGPIALFDLKPGQPQWDELTGWLADHHAALELGREAAAKPAMGFVFGPGGSAYDTAVWPQRQPGEPQDNPLLMSILLPHLHEMRLLAYAFVADARLAREQGDGGRFVRNIDAMIGMADQLMQESVLVQQLVALGIRDAARSAVAETIAGKPSLFSPAQLQHLAHRFARPAAATEIFDIALDRAMFYDVVQRAYTDDGHGDGRLTPEGVRLIARFTGGSRSGAYRSDDAYLHAALMTTPPALMPSRREVVALYDRWMDRAEANLRRPARQATDDGVAEEYAALADSPMQRVRYALPLKLAPSLNRLSTTAERYLGQRDGALIAIALELHRREHGGAYPASLDELSPRLLPTVPVDRVTGGPLRYRLVNGTPLVYSLGADGADDGGTLPRNAHGRRDPYLAANWRLAPTDTPADGDWVLFPPFVETPE